MMVGCAPRCCYSLLAQYALRVVHDAVKFGLAPKKRKEHAPANVELGVFCDMSRAASEGVVVFQPTEKRVRSVLATLKRARLQNHLSPSDASSLFGKLGFTLSAAYGKVGRAATQPLIQRCHRDRAPYVFSDGLQRMHDFLEKLLPSLPPMEVPVAPPALAPGHGMGAAYAYSDASYERNGTNGLENRMRLLGVPSNFKLRKSPQNGQNRTETAGRAQHPRSDRRLQYEG